MLRTISLIAAFITSTIVIGGTAFAQPAPGFYTAIPVTAPAVGRAVTGDLVWACNGQSCAARQGSSRPAIVCAVAARELGALTSFRAGGEDFDAPALEKCNARAK